MEQQMLKDKVAIITGASYGMGRTMAELFADEGAAVVITARHAEQLNEVVDGIRAKGEKAVGVVADVCSTEDTKKVFETAMKEFGDVDILINNAGIGEQKMIDETDDEWMMYVMNTNLGGPMRYIREALKIFLPKNDGVIINICIRLFDRFLFLHELYAYRLHVFPLSAEVEEHAQTANSGIQRSDLFTGVQLLEKESLKDLLSNFIGILY